MYESACDSKQLSRGLIVRYVINTWKELTKIPSNIYTESSNKPCRRIVKVRLGLNYNRIKNDKFQVKSSF